jgi:hypothetical protein
VFGVEIHDQRARPCQSRSASRSIRSRRA